MTEPSVVSSEEPQIEELLGQAYKAVIENRWGDAQMLIANIQHTALPALVEATKNAEYERQVASLTIESYIKNEVRLEADLRAAREHNERMTTYLDASAGQNESLLEALRAAREERDAALELVNASPVTLPTRNASGLVGRVRALIEGVNVVIGRREIARASLLDAVEKMPREEPTSDGHGVYMASEPDGCWLDRSAVLALIRQEVEK